MNHATLIQRLAFAHMLALIIVGDACAQQQPEAVGAPATHAYPCYRLSYSPDTVGYYLPALVQLIDEGATPGSGPHRFARWQGGDVQRQSVRESFKLSIGSANWRQWGDSLLIESHTGLPLMSIQLRRLDRAAAPATSNARADVRAWKGRAFASLNDGPDHMEGDVSVVKASCDTFRTRR